jgi:hypothetical protein
LRPLPGAVPPTARSDRCRPLCEATGGACLRQRSPHREFSCCSEKRPTPKPSRTFHDASFFEALINFKWVAGHEG